MSFRGSSLGFLVLKTPDSIQFDRLLRKLAPRCLVPNIDQIPRLPFEYEYRFTEHEYEYEKNQWYELPATTMPDGPKK
jgi:hypothetical protein